MSDEDDGGHAWVRLNEAIDELVELVRGIDDGLRAAADKNWGGCTWRCTQCGVTAFSKRGEKPKSRAPGAAATAFAEEVDDGYVISWSPKTCPEVVVHSVQES